MKSKLRVNTQKKKLEMKNVCKFKVMSNDNKNNNNNG